MASLPLAFGAVATTGRVFAATAAAKVGNKEEKSFLDWILGNLQKEDQFYETDPILKKVEDKDNGTTSGRKGTTSGRKGTIVVQAPKKNGGGFGGLFAKK